MATLILRLEIDPTTKKKNVIIKYDSDSDALPMEHEQQHKAIVEALIKGGTVKAEDLGHITIEREGQGAVRKTDEKEEPASSRTAVENKS
ncbi:MAG: hypothetical protein ACO1OB_23070 [Archangium sp.]